MSEFFETIKEDWDKLKEKVSEDIKKDNSTTDQLFDYSCTGNPEEVLAESLYAQPQAEKAIQKAMESYREDAKEAETKKSLDIEKS